MITPHFYIAKYIPNPHRMEPKNFGIVAWGEGGHIAFKFLGQEDDGTFKMPAIIDLENRYAYRQWLDFWSFKLNQDSLKRRNGEVIRKDSPDFLCALAESSKVQFRLVQSGHLKERIRPTQLKEFVDEMFQRLVAVEPSSRSETRDSNRSRIRANGITR